MMTSYTQQQLADITAASNEDWLNSKISKTPVVHTNRDNVLKKINESPPEAGSPTRYLPTVVIVSALILAVLIITS